MPYIVNRPMNARERAVLRKGYGGLYNAGMGIITGNPKRFGSGLYDAGASVYEGGKLIYQQGSAPPRKRARITSPKTITSRPSGPVYRRINPKAQLIKRPSRPSQSSRRRRGRYFTTGNYAGKFRAVKERKGTDFAKNGFLMRTEKGGVIEQDKCCYIGHASGAPTKIMTVLFHALMRKMFALAGIHIKTFKEEVFNDDTTTTETVSRVDLVWVAGDTGARRVVSHIVGADTTFETVSNSLQNLFITDFTAAHTAAAFQRFRMIELRYVLASGTTQLNKAKLPLSELYFKLKCSSELTLQNRTLANSGANPENHDSMLDVENNPIEGYKYHVPGTGFVLKWTNDIAAPSVPFVADVNSGVITGDPDNANLTVEERDLLQRPPTNFAFQKCWRSRKVMLGPGELRRNKLVHEKTYHINKLMFLMKDWLLNSLTDRVFVGKSEMFAFEKMMHTTDVTEPDMSIGYECNTFYAGLVWFKKPRILMDKDVL